jgi:hypothetical protein
MPMPNNRDAILLETVKTHRARLLSAFVFGEMADRRIANDNVKRVIGSVVLAAVACAACVGVGFVGKIFASMPATDPTTGLPVTSTTTQTPAPAVTPTPTPSETP